MLKCKMCLGRKLKAKLAVLRSADRSIQYQTSDPIKIDENNVISLKLDSAVLRINNQGELTLDIPSQGDINSILNHLSNYLPSHSLTDSNIPLVTNGAGKAKWATDTIGSDIKPIFLNSGKITASNGNKGSSAKPIYMQNGEFKESSSNLGGATTPIYMQNGELKQGTALNNAAYRDVASSLENSNKLLPSSLIKTLLDGIQNDISALFTAKNITNNGDSFYFKVGDYVFQFIRTAQQNFAGGDTVTVNFPVTFIDKNYFAFAVPVYNHSAGDVSCYIRGIYDNSVLMVPANGSNLETNRMFVVVRSNSNGNYGFVYAFAVGKYR